MSKLTEMEEQLSETYNVYSETCRCDCGCQFFCRPRDSGLCRYCSSENHPTRPHFYEQGEFLKCKYCGIPQSIESSFPKCPRILQQDLPQ